MNRRGFLGAILVAGVAPAVLSSGIIMPVRTLITPRSPLWGASVLHEGLWSQKLLNEFYRKLVLAT